MPRPHLSKSHAPPRRRSGGRVAGCALALAACVAPEVARADRATARTELAVAPADRTPLRDGGSPAFPEPAPVAAAPRTLATPSVEALELRVSYRAADGCPSSGAFLAALQQHVAAGGGGAVDADVTIARASASEYELRLRLQVAGKSSESVTRAESCEALMQLAALNASMARTTPPERSLLGAPLPPPEIGPSAGLEATLPVAPAPRADAEAASTTGAGSFLRGVRPFVTGELRTLSGMLPRQAWGQGINVGVERGAASLRLGATLWRGQQSRFSPERTSDVLLDFEQRSLELSPCAGHPLSGVLRMDGCALLAAHQVSTNGGSARTIGSLGASARATLTPWRGLRIELEGGLSAALERPRFGVQSEPYLYQPEVLQPGARAAIGWEFGGGN